MTSHTERERWIEDYDVLMRNVPNEMRDAWAANASAFAAAFPETVGCQKFDITPDMKKWLADNLRQWRKRVFQTPGIEVGSRVRVKKGCNGADRQFEGDFGIVELISDANSIRGQRLVRVRLYSGVLWNFWLDDLELPGVKVPQAKRKESRMRKLFKVAALIGLGYVAAHVPVISMATSAWSWATTDKPAEPMPYQKLVVCTGCQDAMWRKPEDGICGKCGSRGFRETVGRWWIKPGNFFKWSREERVRWEESTQGPLPAKF